MAPELTTFDVPRTAYGRRLAAYVARVAEARQLLADLNAHDDVAARLARRRVLAQLDAYYVAAAPLRSADPDIRRLRRAERRAQAARQEAS